MFIRFARYFCYEMIIHLYRVKQIFIKVISAVCILGIYSTIQSYQGYWAIQNGRLTFLSFTLISIISVSESFFYIRSRIKDKSFIRDLSFPIPKANMVFICFLSSIIINIAIFHFLKPTVYHLLKSKIAYFPYKIVYLEISSLTSLGLILGLFHESKNLILRLLNFIIILVLISYFLKFISIFDANWQSFYINTKSRFYIYSISILLCSYAISLYALEVILKENNKQQKENELL